MDPSDDVTQRLSQISTHWTAVIRAHHQSTTSAGRARAELLQRYTAAVYRYLLGALRDADAAQELSQEFVVRFLRGDFHRATPERGRFRDYVKTALINLVNDYFRSQQHHRTISPDAPEPASPVDATGREGEFVNCWREQILDRTWAALDQARPNYHAVLRLRVENPQMPAREMAQQLSVKLNKSVTADTVRKTLERARTKFADLLVEEVAAQLESPEIETLQAELKELDLLRYCRSALERRAP